ncbi:gephyrin-like protein [Gonapodya prolifera JEL478]|uniref:Gephyrin-like protein n=1 Tax=Gonapodya prolifera (strain JEL478) TaxID=1344416 RepID=A0A139AKJ0_GONPJ|nr:gephyrin-like protein [Gonapodya prolifera JEL478]|eukprot:KXS17208.1 gephyrin-like protein [Gonapodya prolifera JEL478]
MVRVAIITVSDTCHAEPSHDRSGPALRDLIASKQSDWTFLAGDIVPDDADIIRRAVVRLCDEEKVDLAISKVLEKEAPGLVVAMITESLKVTPLASLSRPVAGVRGSTVIVTLPGSPKGAKENLTAILPALPHAMQLARGESSRQLHTSPMNPVNVAPISSTTSHDYSHNHSHDHSLSHSHDHSHSSSSGGHRALARPLDTPVAFRARTSPYPMISIADAHRTIEQYSTALDAVELPVNPSLVGHVLAEDVFSVEDVPAYRASIVDGYAVIASDGAGEFQVSRPVTAEKDVQVPRITPGQIARVASGAAVPEGADAVVMVEYTEVVRASQDGSLEEVVRVAGASRSGDNIREVGSDMAKGTPVLPKGTLITNIGGELGSLAASGRSKVLVHRKPRVGVLSTGNEVVEIGETLGFGAVRDSNRPTLIAAVRGAGFEVVDLGIAKDEPNHLATTLRSALGVDSSPHEVDVLLTTGGVSMGDLDLLKPVLEQRCGVEILFGRVDVKPGKPLTVGVLGKDEPKGRKLVFALPGNPVSAIVTFHLFGLPALRRLAAHPSPHLPTVPARLLHSVPTDSRPEYMRARLRMIRSPATGLATVEWIAEITGMQRSSRVASLAGANALVRVSPRKEREVEGKEVGRVGEGEVVEAVVLDTEGW